MRTWKLKVGVVVSLALGIAFALASQGGSGGMRKAPSSGDRPVTVRAWRGNAKDKAKEYPTRLLSQLEGFQPKAVTLDKYGGWAGTKEKATGFFYARRIDGRWWLIDPEGNRFLHVAVNGVRPGKSPQMVSWLPKRFGTEARWAEETMSLLKAHGFNGTGAWSTDALNAAAPQRPAYTPIWNFMGSYGAKRGGMWRVSGHMAYTNDCIFAFDPDFGRFADEHAKKLAATKDDPYLLGHFSDNELPCPRDLLDKALKLPADDATYQAAVAWLATRQGGRADAARITDADREAWRGHVADTYFGICARAIRKYDPNHLYLGSRFYGSEKSSQAVFAAAGRHCDVISVNVYGVWTPAREMVDQWTQWSQRPVLVTEWYAKGADSGLPNLTGAGWTVPTQADRGRFYQNFTLGLLESKGCVGWHWFTYIDNDPADTKTDPSNRDSNKGIVAVSYEPYGTLLEAMRQVNQSVYRLTAHFDAKR